jgi:hypothetical protein
VAGAATARTADTAMHPFPLPPRTVRGRGWWFCPGLWPWIGGRSGWLGIGVPVHPTVRCPGVSWATTSSNVQSVTGVHHHTTSLACVRLSNLLPQPQKAICVACLVVRSGANQVHGLCQEPVNDCPDGCCRTSVTDKNKQPDTVLDVLRRNF